MYATREYIYVCVCGSAFLHKSQTSMSYFVFLLYMLIYFIYRYFVIIIIIK